MDYFIICIALLLGFGFGALLITVFQHKSELNYTLVTLKEDMVQFHIKLDKLLSK